MTNVKRTEGAILASGEHQLTFAGTWSYFLNREQKKEEYHSIDLSPTGIPIQLRVFFQGGGERKSTHSQLLTEMDLLKTRGKNVVAVVGLNHNYPSYEDHVLG